MSQWWTVSTERLRHGRTGRVPVTFHMAKPGLWIHPWEPIMRENVY